MNKKPLISVVMPVYNAEKYLKDSIESILKQTYSNFEFIIVDDASLDSSSIIIKSYQKKDKRIMYLKNINNLGVTGSLNKGLKYVKGKYIVRMDADDWSYPDRFRIQIDLMEKNPEVVVSGSYIEVCDSEMHPQYTRRYQIDDLSIRKRMFRYSPFAHPATIWKAEVLKKIQYSEKAKNCEDYELYFRIGKLGKFMNVNKVLLKLRLHSKSVSAAMNDMQSKMTVAIRYNAVKNLGYKMSTFDRLYTWMQSVGIGLLPIKIRFLLFNILRSFDFY